MPELSEEHITIIRNQQQEINNLKEKVKLLSNEIYEVKEHIRKKNNRNMLGYGSEWDD